MPLKLLDHSPFPDFLVPGLVLGLVFGLGSFVTFLELSRRRAPKSAPSHLTVNLARLSGEHWSWSAAVALGVGQVIWIITEVVMLRGFSVLQLVFGALGLLIVWLAYTPSVRRWMSVSVAR
ncbi:hypothetical protein [Deinococcus sp. UYEF24]